MLSIHPLSITPARPRTRAPTPLAAPGGPSERQRERERERERGMKGGELEEVTTYKRPLSPSTRLLAPFHPILSTSPLSLSLSRERTLEKGGAPAAPHQKKNIGRPPPQKILPARARARAPPKNSLSLSLFSFSRAHSAPPPTRAAPSLRNQLSHAPFPNTCGSRLWSVSVESGSGAEHVSRDPPPPRRRHRRTVGL